MTRTLDNGSIDGINVTDFNPSAEYVELTYLGTGVIAPITSPEPVQLAIVMTYAK
jgi:hypothetical protein